MAKKLEICLSPAQLSLFDLKGKVVVIIDVLRATSTINAALANSVKDVPACSKAAQKMMLITIMMVKAIIRSLHTPPSFTPADINWNTTKTKMPIKR